MNDDDDEAHICVWVCLCVCVWVWVLLVLWNGINFSREEKFDSMLNFIIRWFVFVFVFMKAKKKKLTEKSVAITLIYLYGRCELLSHESFRNGMGCLILIIVWKQLDRETVAWENTRMKEWDTERQAQSSGIFNGRYIMSLENHLFIFIFVLKSIKENK